MADSNVKQQPESNGKMVRSEQKDIAVKPFEDFSDIIMVVVGEEKTPYFIPQSILRHNSPFLGQCIDQRKGKAVPDDKKIELRTGRWFLTSKTFNGYVNWIFHQTLGTLVSDRQDHDSAVAAQAWDDLCQLWLLSNHLEDKALCKAILAIFSAEHNDDITWLPSQDTVKRVWHETNSHSPLRQHMLEIFLYLRPSGLDKNLPKFVLDLGKYALAELSKERNRKSPGA